MSLKSGTNQVHGSIYEFARRKAFDSNEYLFKATGREKPNHKLNQYGFQLDGPVKIPGVYDGRNKTFFMFQYEGYDELTPNPATLTFPSQAQINGDFSNLRDAQGNLIVIYDPATGRQVGNQWVRDPFPGNIIPGNRINPIAQKLLSSYPRPNITPASGDPWRNNYTFAPNLATDDFYNIAAKVDQNLSDKTRMFFSYGKNKRTETRYTNGILSGPAQDGQLPLQRLNDRIVADWVRTTRSALVWNIRTSVNQYVELARSDPGLGFDVTELGFPAPLANQLPNKAFPRVNVADYTQLGRNNRNRETTTVWSFQPNLSYVRGTHNVRGGLDMRMTWYTRESTGNLFVLDFDRRYTQRVFNQAEALAGNSIASLLLGAPHGGAVDNNFFPEFRWNYSAPWIQDDWRIGNRLTVNLGLRWDLNSPVFEEQNRLNYGFSTTDINPVTPRIDQARFPGYVVRGGVGFVATDDNPRYPYKWDKGNIQPRAGFAYMLTDRTILRGGYGKYFLNVTGTTTSNGFSIQAPVVGSLNDHRTPTLALSNPFPNGIAEARGADGGLLTFLGRNPSFSSPDYDNPYVHQFSLGVQRMLPWRTTVEASYVGSRTLQEQNSWGGFNDVPLDLRNRCDPTQGGTVAFCNELQPNPFFGVPGFEGTARFTSPTLSRSDLSRPFPQFTNFTMFERNDGRIWYNSAQFVASKRASGGLTINGTYTLSKMTEENGFRDDTAMILQKSPYTTDRRQRVTVSGVWNLPFGRDQRFGSNIPAALNAVLGGWEMAGMFLYNSGRPWDLPANVFYVKDAKLPEIEWSGNTIRGVQNCVARMSDTGVVTMQTFSVFAGCTEPNFIIRPNFTGRTTNFRDDEIRRPSFSQFDMNFAKMTRISDRLRVQLRIELFNVFNWEMYDERQFVSDANNALFGAIDRTVTRQSNFPRYGQLGIKLLF